jgi:hypothetical protein
MCFFCTCVRGVVTSAALFSIFCFQTASAETQPARVQIKAVQGQALYSADHKSWQRLKPGMSVSGGIYLKTEARSSADLILNASGTVLRMTEGTVLEITKLEKAVAGEDVITETSLNLQSGGVIGSQRKLSKPSRFDITLPAGKATIVGTEYLVRADGSVTCLTGDVAVTYNLPQNGGSVKVSVPAGASFDSATGQVVPTTDSYLQNIIADVDTVRNNAQVFKADKASVIVKPESMVSPTKGNNGVGNGVDPAPPGNPPVNDGPGTGPGDPGKGK